MILSKVKKTGFSSVNAGSFTIVPFLIISFDEIEGFSFFKSSSFLSIIFCAANPSNSFDNAKYFVMVIG